MHRDGAQSLGMVRSKRIIGEKESTQVRHHISSLPMGAEKFAHALANMQPTWAGRMHMRKEVVRHARRTRRDKRRVILACASTPSESSCAFTLGGMAQIEIT